MTYPPNCPKLLGILSVTPIAPKRRSYGVLRASDDAFEQLRRDNIETRAKLARLLLRPLPPYWAKIL